MKRLEKLRNLGLVALALFLFSCAGGGGGDSEPVPAEKQLIPDGKYRLSAFVLENNEIGTIAPTIQGDLHVTFKWLGKGKYSATSGGMANILFLEESFVIDCSSNDIVEITLDENGEVISVDLREKGCLPPPSISGGAKVENAIYKLIDNGIQLTYTGIINEEKFKVTETYMRL